MPTFNNKFPYDFEWTSGEGSNVTPVPVKIIQLITAEGSCIVFMFFFILTKLRIHAIPYQGRIQDLEKKGVKPDFGEGPTYYSARVS